MKRCFAILAVAVIAGVAQAAPAERDLGNGLAYLRVKQLPGDVPGAVPERPMPCVVDLRYVKANSDSAAPLLEWLKRRGTGRAAIFVLANGDTARELTRPLTALPRSDGVVVVGIPSSGFAPHVAVSAKGADERAAYDALDKGLALAALLTDNPNKLRNDEASLSRDRLADASADSADGTLEADRPKPRVDATLQRAVHLHRALVALRKL